MEMIGYAASILIGISLGLIGGGGSILTVPVLVYLFQIEPIIATAYSLFVVGSTSTIGFLSYYKDGLVQLKTAFLFALPSVITVYLTRTFVLPAIPNDIIDIGDFHLTKNIFLLLVFAVLMIVAAYQMIKTSTPPVPSESNKIVVMALGSAVGILTGLVGAGGGFLIIPALVTFLHTPMKTAVGTSLLIISINSLFGFFSTINLLTVQWTLLMTITGIAILGIFIGFALSKKIDGKKLKPAFGWFVLLMGTYILTKELFFK